MKNILKFLSNYIVIPMIAAVIMNVIIKSFFFISVTKGDSMFPTVENGSYSIGIMNPKEINKQDIVILPLEDKHIVKRVIATEGDKVGIIDGTIYINDGELEDVHYALRDHTNFAPIIVPQGEIFVLGDNRAVSLDSRELGTYKVEDVVAKLCWNIDLKKL